MALHGMDGRLDDAVVDPDVIHEMRLLRECDVYLLMGSAVFVAVLGSRRLRHVGAKAVLTGGPIEWTNVRPEPRHIGGCMLFGLGGSIAGTCPGPAAVMIGEGNVSGAVVAAGILTGVFLHSWLPAHIPGLHVREQAGAPGL